MSNRPSSERAASSTPAPPPRGATRLLERGVLGRSPLGRGLSAAERGEIIDSLADLYVIRRTRRGRVRAGLWYWWQVVSFPAHTVRDQLPDKRRRYSRKVTGMFSNWFKDARYAIRGLAGAPGFTIVALLALALGIGQLTPTFSLINAYLLRPLPFDEPDRLVHLWETAPRRGSFTSRVAYPNFRDWRDRSESFQDMAAFNYTSEELTEGDRPERISSGRVSWNVFEVLGVEPLLGRGFEPGEDTPGNTQVVVLSHGFWENRYDADPDVLGSTLEINRTPHTIVGVMGPEFVFPLPTTQFWVPRPLDEASRPRDERFLQVVGRMNPGVTMAQAQAEMDGIAGALAQEFPDTNTDAGVNVVDLRSALNFADEVLGIMSVILLIAGGFVLLIVCANVSSLLLARSMARRREVAIRTALGATRAQLLRQFLTESLVLAVGGGALGLMLAQWLTGLSAGAIPPDIYRIGEIEIDLAAVLFTFGVCVITALVFGLVPALRASSIKLGNSLREGHSATSSRSSLRLRNALVVSQITLALVLLTGTSMMVRTLDDMRNADTGFVADNVLTATMVLQDASYEEPTARRAYHRQVVEELRAVPGVTAAATANFLPLNHESSGDSFSVPGVEPPSDGQTPVAIALRVSPDYFAAMGIPMRSGRAFDARDNIEAARVAIINDVFAERYWPDGDPMGAEILVEDTPVQIVGVVADSKHVDLTSVREKIYYPADQGAGSYFRLVVRTDSDPLAMVDSIRQAIWQVDPDLPINQVRTLDAVVADFLLPQRMMASALAGFSGGAIVLACVGIYGLIAFIVSQSTREMSIRMALGAGGRDVLGQVLKSGLRLTGIGIACGFVGALGLAQLLSAFVSTPDHETMLGAGALDLTTFALLPLALAVMAMLACYFPARRATRVDPIVAMRAE